MHVKTYKIYGGGKFWINFGFLFGPVFDHFLDHFFDDFFDRFLDMKKVRFWKIASQL